MHKILIVSFLLALPGCAAPVLLMTGVSAASVATNETTGKTITDHVVSAVNGKDCRVNRMGKEDICQEDYTVKLKVTTSGVEPSSVQEIQSRYQ
jgi:hypothetical protein